MVNTYLKCRLMLPESPQTRKIDKMIKEKVPSNLIDPLIISILKEHNLLVK